MRAVADSTRLYRLPAVVRRRTAAKGDSTTFVVRRCRQCSGGNWEHVMSRSQSWASRSTALGASVRYRWLNWARHRSHALCVSAYGMAVTRVLASGWTFFGMASSTLTIRWFPQRCSAAVGCCSPKAAQIEIEIVPLADDLGLPTGRVLQIIRNKW